VLIVFPYFYPIVVVYSTLETLCLFKLCHMNKVDWIGLDILGGQNFEIAIDVMDYNAFSVCSSSGELAQMKILSV